MTITTTDFIAGREITETLDLARGSTVRARNIGRDFLSGLKNLVTFLGSQNSISKNDL